MHYTVITGGPIPDEAQKDVEGTVFCADGGADFCRLHGLLPQCVYGDMDSISEEGLEFIRSRSISTKVYPCEKDWTDTEIALGEVPAGADVTLICPIEGRIDHVIGNIQLASQMSERLGRIVLSDGITHIYMMTGPDDLFCREIDDACEMAVSLVPLSVDAQVTGVRTTDLYYRLGGESLAAGKTFSFSNRLASGKSGFEISIQSGRLAVIVTKAV